MKRRPCQILATGCYAYDDWNLFMERRCEPSCEAETVRAKYAWGLDLSRVNGAGATGNVQSAVHGAGGIGGLLSMPYCGSVNDPEAA